MNNNQRAGEFGWLLAASAAKYTIELEAAVTHGPIHPRPVQLEPLFRRLDPAQTFAAAADRSVPVTGPQLLWRFRRLILSRTDAVDWRRAAAVLERVAGCKGPLSFELWLDHEQAMVYLGASCDEIDFVAATWAAVFPECAIVEARDPGSGVIGDIALLYELVSPAGYQAAIHASTAVTPWATIFQLCADLPPGERVVCQVLFSPVQSALQQNIPRILETERSLGHRAPYGRTAQPKSLEEPLFAATIRIRATTPAFARGIEAFAGTFTAEGKPFRYRTKDEYLAVLPVPTMLAMCSERAAHAPGQIFAASELSLFVHLPTEAAAGSLRLDLVCGLPVPERLRVDGIPLGVNSHRGVLVPVFLPADLPNRCCWIIGSSRSGKTTALVHRFRHLALQGQGVLFLDPHRETALTLPGLLRGLDPTRVVHLDFDANEPVSYNPFCHADPKDVGRLTLEAVQSFKSLFDTDGYHRMTHFIGMGVYALYLLRENLAILPLLFSPEGERLRRHVIAHAQNATVRRFWEAEYPRHRADAFAPIVNRLSALLLDDRTLRTFTQRENRVDIAHLMNEGMAVSVALPGNIEAGKIVGGLIIAEAKHAAFRRVGTPAAKRHYTVIIDEFHRFLSSAAAIESIVNETAKGGLSVIVANQETGQLPGDLLKALFSMPAILTFGVNLPDARMLAPLFNGHVTPETLASQRTGEVHGRIGQDIVNYVSPRPCADVDQELATRIIAHSEATYHTVASVDAPAQAPAKRTIETF